MELTISRLIKLIIGILVFIVVIVGLYMFFKNRVIDLFTDLPVEPNLELIRSLLS